MNWEFISQNGGSTGSVLFKMTVDTILDFEKLLPFHYLLIDGHHIKCKYRDVDFELIDVVQNT